MDKEKRINQIIERTVKYATKNIDANFATRYAQQIQQDARRYIIGCNSGDKITMSSADLVNYIIVAKRVDDDRLAY